MPTRRARTLPFRPALPLRVAAALSAVGLVAAYCEGLVYDPSDLLVHLDVFDGDAFQLVEAVPNGPIVFAGPDAIRGTADDFVARNAVGDLDFILRAGVTTLSAPFPTPQGTATSLAAPNGLGSDVDFVVRAVQGFESDPLAFPVDVSPSVEGHPLVVLAFADLDGDGRIGPSVRDGANGRDAEVESAELVPVGTQVVFLSGASASGRMRLLAGAPAAHPLRVALTAIAFSGPTDPSFLGGVVPKGPALMTALPMLPPFVRADLFDAGPQGPEVPTTDRPLNLRFDKLLVPEPTDPVWGGVLDLPLDGSEVSIDVASAASGPATHFGVVRSALDSGYLRLPRRPVRPGQDAQGQPHPFEVASRVHVADDGAASTTTIRIVPLDRLGSIADPSASELVTLTTRGNVSILSPNDDGDPHHETLSISSAAGAAVVLDDRGGVFDDPNQDLLVLSSPIGGSLTDLVLPDPDVDDSGRVDRSDLDLVRLRRGVELGEQGFEDFRDVDGNGRINQKDEQLVQAALQSVIPVP